MARPDRHDKARATILVVEDEPPIQRLIATNLERQGYVVLVAGSAHDALEQVAAHPLDLMVLDMTLPDEDGYVLLQRLRAGGPNRLLPVIALTQPAGKAETFRGWGGAGVDGWLTKPFNPVELIAMVRRILHDWPSSGGWPSWRDII